MREAIGLGLAILVAVGVFGGIACFLDGDI